MRMKLLLLGNDNLLGQSLIEQGLEEDILFFALPTPKNGWSFEDLSRTLEEVNPDCIVNLAYYFDWFQAREGHTETLCKQMTFVEQLAQHCQAHSIVLFQPSSYRVFGGTRITAYNETDEPLPLSLLGQALWNIEQIVMAECSSYILVRFGWLLDYSAEGKVGRLIQRARTQQELQLADDRRGNPTPIDDAARVMLGILQQIDCKTNCWGIYHYGAMEAISSLGWSQVALDEARKYEQELTKNIVAKPHTSFPDAIVEPQYAVLDCKKILYTFGIKQRAWRTAITELFKAFYRQ